MATILIVDDNDSLRSNVRHTLEESNLDVQVVEACDGAQALPLALSGDIDVVVSDIVMPNLNGIELLRGIRQVKDAVSLPLILITADQDENVRDLSFDVGVSDYLVRPFLPEELVDRVRVQLRLRELNHELRVAAEKHRQSAALDGMTGLFNRTHFLEVCAQEMTRAIRHQQTASLGILDLDNLRLINDRIGSRATDAVLMDAIDVFRRQLRTSDILARFGSGTFGVLLPHTDEPQAQILGNRICAAVAAHRFPEHEVGDITVSVGLASFPSAAIANLDDLANLALARVDTAKAKQGNCVEPSLQTKKTEL